MKVTHQHFNISSSDTPSPCYLVRTRNIVLISNIATTPIKFGIKNITIDGILKGILKIEKCEWIAIELFQLKAEDLSFEYDKNNGITNNKYESLLSNLCKEALQLHVLVKAQDIKRIETKYPSNLNILNKSSDCPLIEIIYNCQQCSLNEMTNDLKLISRNYKIKISNFHMMEYSAFEYINSEFWTTVVEFDNITFEWRSGQLIKIIGIHDYFNKDHLNENSFKIFIEGKEEIASYSAILIMLS